MTFGARIQGATKDAGTISGNTTLVFGSNVTVGDTLLCTVRRGGTTTGDVTVSDNLNGNWTKDAENAITSAGVMSNWRFSNAAAGATTVTVNVVASTTIRFAIQERTGNFGLDTTSTPAGGFKVASGNSNAPNSGNLTTDKTCEIVGSSVTGLNIALAGTYQLINLGAGWTNEDELDHTSGSVTEYAVAMCSMGATQVAGTYSLSGTIGSSGGQTDSWGAIVLAYFDAGGGTVGPHATPPIVAPSWAMLRSSNY